MEHQNGHSIDGGIGGIPLDHIAEPLRSLAVPIASLTIDPANTRTHDEKNLEAIAGSLARFGQRSPVVVQRQGMIVRAGNGRVLAARTLGWGAVAALVVDESDVEATAFSIADNRTAELAGWDDGALARTLEALPKELRIGFDDTDLAELLAKVAGPVVEDETPEPLPEAVSRRGDVWLLGGHRLLCGDSTDGGDVALCMNGERAGLCVTSPPYNCNIEYASHDDDMDPAEYSAFVERVVIAVVASLTDGGFVAWNVGVTPKSQHFEHAAILKRAGMVFQRQIVWAKSGVAFPIWQYTTAARKYHPNYCHEVIYLFSKGDPVPGAACERDERFSRDVWTIHQSASTRDLPGVSNGRKPRNNEHGGSKAAAHPAAYPIGIPEGCIKHLTSVGEIAYEPFSGSGTTLIACEQLNRRCYAIEIEPRYVDVAIRRWQKLTNKHATIDGKTWADVAAERGVTVAA